MEAKRSKQGCTHYLDVYVMFGSKLQKPQRSGPGYCKMMTRGSRAADGQLSVEGTWQWCSEVQAFVWGLLFLSFPGKPVLWSNTNTRA